MVSAEFVLMSPPGEGEVAPGGRSSRGESLTAWHLRVLGAPPPNGDPCLGSGRGFWADSLQRGGSGSTGTWNTLGVM